MGVFGQLFNKNPYAKYGEISKRVIAIVQGAENKEQWALAEESELSLKEIALAKLHIHGEKASKGDINALFDVGMHLAFYDANESYKILSSLANEGFVPAMTQIAYFFQGIYEKNSEQRKYWLLKASQSGHDESQCELAEMYVSENNLDEAERWLIESAEQNYLPAMINLSRLMKIKDEQAEIKMDSHTLYEQREDLLVRAVNMGIDLQRSASPGIEKKEHAGNLLWANQYLAELYMEYEEWEGALESFATVYELGDTTAQAYAKAWLYKLEHEYNYKIPDEIKQKITQFK